MNLLQLKKGESGIIKKVVCEKKLKQRLITMGFTQGAKVKLDKKAPLGDPIDFVVKDYHISLRKTEAMCIEIEAVNSEK
ncbi:MAG: hypothetical protein C0601_00180 [Candidatus Muiribacterium halophilum]|uniref:Ferrous iron transporter FeoA-like domain-containing protein n=1 Tax=Muiribacterium halophilum TaxID=2053465 RepID=A0A2N5ZN35_MUIH1|nr:MAG: hypothetical protein C0601_00180 [Candidatus Muirbacterium halophilum]